MAKKRAKIVGEVTYSAGDGASQRIPPGPCEVEATSLDVTISWMEGEVAGVAALPVDTYTTYLTEGRIVLEG